MGMNAQERLKFVLTADVSGALTGFSSVGAAADKELHRAGSKLDMVGGNLTKFGAGAIAAAGVVGVALKKSGDAFSHLGIEVGHFKDATGVGYDKASRLVEVMKDLGMDASTLEGGLGKLNRAAETTPDAFAKIGAEIVRTASGAVDTELTFENVIDAFNRTGGASAHSAEAVALFGKGWQSMSELIASGSDSLRTKMAAVDDVKVFDAGKVQAAKDYREAMDKVSDSVDKLVLSIGQGAAPVIGTLATVIGGAVSAFGSLNAISGGAAGSLLTVASAAVGVAGAISVVAGQTIKMRGRFTDADGALNNFGKTAKGVGIAFGLLGAAAVAYSVDQWQVARSAKQTAAAIDLVTSAADRQAQVVSQVLLASYQALGRATPDEAVDKLAASSLAATIRMRDMAVANSAYAAELAAGGVSVGMLDAAIVKQTESQKRSTDANAKAADEADKLTGSTDKGGDAQKDFAKASDESQRAAKDLTQAIDDERKAIEDLYDEQLSQLDAQYAAEQATRDMQAAIMDFNAEAGNTPQELADAGQSVRDWATAQAIAKLGTDKGKEAIDDQIVSLGNVAALLAPDSPLRVELLRYIENLKQIPGNVATNITATIIGLNPQARNAVKPAPSTDAANWAALLGNTPGVPQLKALAHGSSSSPDTFIAGEYGPELVVGHPNSTVFTAGQTARMLGGGSAPNYITINTGADPQQVIQIIKRYTRNGGVL